MSKKLKVLLVTVAAVVLFTIGSGVAVLAQDDEATVQTETLVARVAAILGITEPELTDALNQAREQVANEVIDKWLANAVANGRITEEDKAAIEQWLTQRPDPSDEAAWQAWLDARPEISKPGFLKGLWQAKGRIMQYAWSIGKPGAMYGPVLKKTAEILGIDEQELLAAFRQAMSELKDDKVATALGKAVRNGRITQDEADQISSWWGQRPSAVDKVMPGLGAGGIKNAIQQQIRSRIQPRNCQ